MAITISRVAQIAVAALLLTVLTQVLYITLSGLGVEPNRQIIWSLEVLAFLVIAISGLALLPSRPVLGGAMAAGGLLNTIQAGIGLTMFGPLAGVQEVFGAVLSLAFMLYFAGKVAFGIAAVAAGLALLHAGNTATQIAGVLAGLTGVAAALLNAAAIMLEADLTYVAGGIGTLATLFLAAVLVPAARQEKDDRGQPHAPLPLDARATRA